ncbi:MAG: AAC(3) family N-acetyltransferase [Thermotogota bacterium]|nr:AAC(3) family N-acetyltransferase [Thermotogota bacterium]
MYTKADLMKQIKELGIKPTDTLLIHSSMKSIGLVEGRGDTVLYAFMEYLNKGLLVFPTHTWEQLSDTYNVFDPKKEPSCVGILSNLFMQRLGVYRSLHPTHSVAAFGKDAESYTQGEEDFNTPCPREGCWGKLYDLNAKILFIGCSLRANTIIHGVEEWNHIPNRLSKWPQPLKIKLEDGQIIDRPLYRHHNESGDVSKNYVKLTEPLLSLGLAEKRKTPNFQTYNINN